MFRAKAFLVSGILFLLSGLILLVSSSTALAKESAARKPDLKSKEKEVECRLFPKRRVLKATVTASDSFPPMPKSLRCGKIFDRNKVNAPDSEGANQWYQVPEWFSGEFSYGKAWNAKIVDFLTGKTYKSKTGKPLKHGRLRGIFRDKEGNIWQKSYGGRIVDRVNENKNSKYEKYRMEDALFGSIIDDTHYNELSYGVEFFISRKTKKIQMVVRYERIRNFELMKDGTVVNHKIEKKFDQHGNPLLMGTSDHIMDKRSAFVPLKPGQYRRGCGSYKESLNSLIAFMKLRGMTDAIPDIDEAPVVGTKDSQKIDASPSPKGSPVPSPRTTR